MGNAAKEFGLDCKLFYMCDKRGWSRGGSRVAKFGWMYSWGFYHMTSLILETQDNPGGLATLGGSEK